MSTARRDAIIDDLLKKRPNKGSTKVTYEPKQKYCYDRSRYVYFGEPSCPYYGYNPEELFELGLENQSDAKHYVRERFFAGKSSWEIGRKKSTVTRRANRIWNRIEAAVRHVKKIGGCGVYKVIDRGGYRSQPMGHVYGISMPEARETARMSFGYLARNGDSSNLDVEFMKLGTIKELSNLNAVTIDQINNKIQGEKDNIISAGERIKMLEARLTTLTLVEAQMISLDAANDAK